MYESNLTSLKKPIFVGKSSCIISSVEECSDLELALTVTLHDWTWQTIPIKFFWKSSHPFRPKGTTTIIIISSSSSAAAAVCRWFSNITFQFLKVTSFSIEFGVHFQNQKYKNPRDDAWWKMWSGKRRLNLVFRPLTHLLWVLFPSK